MRSLWITMALLFAIGGCAKKEESVKRFETAEGRHSQASGSAYLAYEHAIGIDTEEGKVGLIFEAAQAACREAEVDLCTVLEAQINTGRAVTASLKFRAKPAGIRKLIAALGKQGEITDQSTSAEDLAGPVADGARKLAMLNDYRTKLEAMRERASRDVDALIKVNRELAEVQSQIEAMSGKQQHLMQRVETEVLNVTIRSDQHQSFSKPIARAFADFGRNLSEGISTAITGLAYLLPWVVVLGVPAWAIRRLWRRRKQQKIG